MPKREHKKKDDDIPCYECGKLGHYRTTYPSLTKHHKKKDKEFYKKKGKSTKGRRAYITWEEEDESSSSYSCSSSNDECVNLCLIAWKKNEDSHVYTFDLESNLSYRELPKEFDDMYVDSLNVFKKIYF